MPRVLVIDDDVQLRTVIRDALELDGHVILEACDGADGLSLYDQARPDVVIVDMIMPNKEGVETLMDLSRRPHPPPVIAISGGGRVGDMTYLKIARKFGARFVLAKPFDISELQEAVSACTGHAK